MNIVGVLVVVYVVLLCIMPESWNGSGYSVARNADGTLQIVGSHAIPPTGFLAIGLTLLICYRQMKRINEAIMELNEEQ